MPTLNSIFYAAMPRAAWVMLKKKKKSCRQFASINTFYWCAMHMYCRVGYVWHTQTNAAQLQPSFTRHGGGGLLNNSWSLIKPLKLLYDLFISVGHSHRYWYCVDASHVEAGGVSSAYSGLLYLQQPSRARALTLLRLKINTQACSGAFGCSAASSVKHDGRVLNSCLVKTHWALERFLRVGVFRGSKKKKIKYILFQWIIKIVQGEKKRTSRPYDTVENSSFY